MTKPIPNYPGDKRSLVNDAIFLIHLRALNLAGADRAVSFEQTWFDKELNPDFPVPYRTAQRCLGRLTSVAFVVKRAGTGRSKSVYYALPCGLERMSYALHNGLSEWTREKGGVLTTMYAPPDSPVCLTWADNCQCIQTLFFAEQIPDDLELSFFQPIRAILIPKGELDGWHWQPFQRWQRRKRTPYILYAARYFIKQLRWFEGQLGDLNVWNIPSVKHIVEEVERLSASPR